MSISVLPGHLFRTFYDAATPHFDYTKTIDHNHSTCPVIDSDDRYDTREEKWYDRIPEH